MNKWNVLLNALDAVYGHDGKNNSTFTPISRRFDQATGQMITVIEYKNKKLDEIVIKKKQRAPVQQGMGFLQKLLNQNKAKSK